VGIEFRSVLAFRQFADRRWALFSGLSPPVGKSSYDTVLTGSSASRPRSWPCALFLRPGDSPDADDGEASSRPLGRALARMRLYSAFPVCRRAFLRIQASGLV
jgi:hypothetical protein